MLCYAMLCYVITAQLCTMLCYAYAMLCYSILFIIIEYGFLVHVIDLKKREIILH
jgi:hypothetical protein